jgi:MYXO-CTERM domain-containing protein
MITKMRATARMAAVGLAVMFGSLTITLAAAQDAEPAATEEEDGGFDDWGLLGLLGLAGLAGLRKREPEVRTTQPRR